MRPFRFERVDDPRGATALVADTAHSSFLGGGTNLVDLMRLGVESPVLLVDVSHLAGGDVNETIGGGLRIGAAVPNSDLAAHPLVRERYPLLSSALLQGASGQLRNMATAGGNLLQRTRCGYFQDVTKPCNKRQPGSGCPALPGEHRNHAILGWSEECVATHPSDLAVALVALDAVVHLEGPAGPRSLPIAGLHRLPGREPERDTVLEHGDLIVAIELPAPVAGNWRYVKVRERAAFSFAVVSLAAALDVRDGTVRLARLALGGVAHKPWRALRAEAVLEGAPAGEETFARAADAELEHARPLRDNAYKVALARRVIVTTLHDLGSVS
ncbi:MAG TPA: xanthine dehydrogenase family protein subunit M [Gaiellales bacterium]|jgi:xanthine dehydrogenase YagS FAD-binding subunit|nr:xanthine dehydrogenase family protein subunit M [Gaiellales bacterium]